MDANPFFYMSRPLHEREELQALACSESGAGKIAEWYKKHGRPLTQEQAELLVYDIIILG